MEETFSLENQINSSPKEIKDFLTKGVWSFITSEITKKNNFSTDQSVSLENETLFVLIGLELKRDFKENIKRELTIPDILARDIADEIEERIFKQVNDFLPTEVEGETSAPSGIPQKPILNNTSAQTTPVTSDRALPNNVIPAKSPLDILQKQNSLPTTPLEQALSQKTTEPENPVMEKKYYPGQDPYREPV